MAHCNAAIVVDLTHPVGKNVKHFFSLYTKYTRLHWQSDLSAIPALVWRNSIF